MRVVCLGLGRRGRQWVSWAKEAGAGGPPAPTCAEDNLKTLAMAFTIVASSRLKREVSLDEVLAGEV